MSNDNLPPLLPCPCCGAHLPEMVSDSENSKRHTIKCTECPIRGEYFSSTSEQAIAAWNRRDAVAASGAGVPDGWKRVPIEPTTEMLDSCRAWYFPGITLPLFVAAYKTMLAAAPTHDSDGGEVADPIQALVDQAQELDMGYIPHPNIARYEYVRCLHPCEFEQIVSANIAGVGKFDDLVDKAIAAQLEW